MHAQKEKLQVGLMFREQLHKTLMTRLALLRSTLLEFTALMTGQDKAPMV